MTDISRFVSGVSLPLSQLKEDCKRVLDAMSDNESVMPSWARDCLALICEIEKLDRRMSMAHADYNCCAVCDCKRSYNDDAEAKEEICPECLRNLHKAGASDVYTVGELVLWIEETTANDLAKTLVEVGYCACWYGNPVDEAVKLRLGDTFIRARSH